MNWKRWTAFYSKSFAEWVKSYELLEVRFPEYGIEVIGNNETNGFYNDVGKE